jgi:hypothetical protein
MLSKGSLWSINFSSILGNLQTNTPNLYLLSSTVLVPSEAPVGFENFFLHGERFRPALVAVKKLPG